MKKILILGAGKSATDLIHYLIKYASTYQWHVTVADADLLLAKAKIGDPTQFATAIEFDVHNDLLRNQCVQNADLVISVLPASLHYLVAQSCLQYQKHFITPSYISEKEWAMEKDFKEKKLLFLGEMGLDPGIDHMSLMDMLQKLKDQQATIQSIISATGALIAPESNNNPWNYKFTWAPINVVLAGQATAQYLHQNTIKYVPYSRMFQHCKTFEVPQYGTFEAYPNRNSLPYLHTYGIQNVPTFMRATLRYKGYCAAWNNLVTLGLTDNTFNITNPQSINFYKLIHAFLPTHIAAIPNSTLLQKVALFLNIPPTDPSLLPLQWLNIFDNQMPNFTLSQATPATALLQLLEQKWQLQPNDKDMVIMIHTIDYKLPNATNTQKITATLTAKGTDAQNTAISKYVGIPMAIAAKLLLTNQITLTGIHLPIHPQIYVPCLNELQAQHNVVFTEQIETI